MPYLYALFLTFFLAIPKPALEAPIIEGQTLASVEEKTETAKSDPPEILQKIAECESGGRHFDKNGEVIKGVNIEDVGKYQINTKYWAKEAQKLGYDLHTEEGNEAMAHELYRRYGTKPWRWSKKCWEN
jgi:hypothetical protein